MGVVGRGNCESYSEPLPAENIFISFSTLKQAIYYFMYVQCPQSQGDLKAGPERGKPDSSTSYQQRKACLENAQECL